MSTGSWLKTHKKQIITHTLIVGGFLFFLLFLSGPLFDKFEASEVGLSNLQKISLPAETNEDEMYQEIWGICRGGSVELMGFAFMWGQSAEDSQFYIVLRSIYDTYVFDTFPFPMPDVTSRFAQLNLNLDNSGFYARVPIKKIENGTYRLGIYLKKGDIEALQYIDKIVVRSGSSADLIVLVKVTSELQEILLPPESGEIRFAIDMCKAMKDENEKGLMQIQGWAFIAGQSAENSTIYMVLKSGTATYIFDTILQERPDVTAYYVESGLNLDDSGFIAGIPVNSVEEGIYELGIYIKKGDIEALQYTNKVVEF
jgi:hypothetical protein